MTNPVKVGIFAFITIVIFILGFYFLKGINLFTTKNRYYAVYNQVDGLYTSNHVVINGFKVGTIRSMNIDPKTGKVIVEILSTYDYPVPDNSIASIQSTDLVGGKLVSIKLGDSKKFLNSGDTIKTVFKKDLASTLGDAIDPLVNDIKTTLRKLNEVLDRDDPRSTVYVLNKSLTNIESISRELDATLKSGSLDKSLSNIESITSNIEKNNKNIDRLLNNLAVFSDSLKETELKSTIASAKLAIGELKHILDDINKGKGTLGKLVKDEKLYANIEAASSNLDKLLVDVKDHPFRYVNVSVFGGQKRDDKYKAKLAKEEAAKTPKK